MRSAARFLWEQFDCPSSLAGLPQLVTFATSLPLYVTAIALSVVLAKSAAVMRQFRSVGFLSGRISRYKFQMGFNYYKPINFINAELPGKARVMCLQAPMNYGLNLFCHRRELVCDKVEAVANSVYQPKA